jgi:hypothetical protein
LWVVQVSRNAKFLLTLIFKNDFWVQRVAKDEGSRVLIIPTALLGACEIDKIEKFLLPLINKEMATSPSAELIQI